MAKLNIMPIILFNKSKFFSFSIFIYLKKVIMFYFGENCNPKTFKYFWVLKSINYSQINQLLFLPHLLQPLLWLQPQPQLLPQPQWPLLKVLKQLLREQLQKGLAQTHLKLNAQLQQFILFPPKTSSPTIGICKLLFFWF